MNGGSVDGIFGSIINGRAGVEAQASGDSTAAFLGISQGTGAGILKQNLDTQKQQSAQSLDAIYAVSVLDPSIYGATEGGAAAAYFLA